MIFIFFIFFFVLMQSAISQETAYQAYLYDQTQKRENEPVLTEFTELFNSLNDPDTETTLKAIQEKKNQLKKSVLKNRNFFKNLPAPFAQKPCPQLLPPKEVATNKEKIESYYGSLENLVEIDATIFNNRAKETKEFQTFINNQHELSHPTISQATTSSKSESTKN